MKKHSKSRRTIDINGILTVVSNYFKKSDKYTLLVPQLHSQAHLFAILNETTKASVVLQVNPTKKLIEASADFFVSTVPSGLAINTELLVFDRDDINRARSNIKFDLAKNTISAMSVKIKRILETKKTHDFTELPKDMTLSI